MPSDLSGINVATHDSSRLSSNIGAALSTASFQISEAIEKAVRAEVGTASASAPHPPAPTTLTVASGSSSASDPLGLSKLATKHVADLLAMLGSGTAGPNMVPSDAAKVKRWAENVVYMAWDVFRQRQDDVYATWLRPDTSKPPELVGYSTEGTVDIKHHHAFAAGEGLAGKSWSLGKAAGHSPGRPHEWWAVRKGCENNSFICAPVGPFEGTGGVLGVGSDKGFRVMDEDVAIVQMFASLLGFVVPLLPVNAGSPATVPMKRPRSAGPRNRSGA